MAHHRGRLVISPGRKGYRGGRSVANAGICMEVIGKHFWVYCNTPDLLNVYRGREDSAVQSKPEVVVAVPYLGGCNGSKEGEEIEV